MSSFLSSLGLSGIWIKNNKKEDLMNIEKIINPARLTDFVFCKFNSLFKELSLLALSVVEAQSRRHCLLSIRSFVRLPRRWQLCYKRWQQSTNKACKQCMSFHYSIDTFSFLSNHEDLIPSIKDHKIDIS